jgi:hypothetical protein
VFGVAAAVADLFIFIVFAICYPLFKAWWKVRREVRRKEWWEEWWEVRRKEWWEEWWEVRRKEWWEEWWEVRWEERWEEWWEVRTILSIAYCFFSWIYSISNRIRRKNLI